VCVIAVVAAIAEAAAGIAIAVQTEGRSYATTHPYVALGVAVIAAGVISGVLLFCAGTYVKMRAYTILMTEQRRLGG